MITARTAKEKWALAIWNKMQELAVERGDEPKEELDGIYFVRKNSGKDTKLYELEDMYKLTKCKLEQTRKSKKVAAYFETEEGKERKERLEKQLEFIREQSKATHAFHRQRIIDIVNETCGNGWGIDRLTDTFVEIGMIDPEKPGNFIFAQTISVYYEAEHFYYEDGPKCREKFEFCIGSTGSFEVITEDGTARAKFYIGVGKLLDNKAALEGLKAEMSSLHKAVESAREDAGLIQKELDNPFEA